MQGPRFGLFNLRLWSQSVTMGEIADHLNDIAPLGCPVVDQTGLAGNFDLTIEWAQESNGSPQSDVDAQPESRGPTFQQALKEQLGMKLVKRNAQVQVPVIDHVERHSEN